MEVQNQPLVPNWRNVFLTVVRLLSFRATTEELLGLGSRHLAFGLLFIPLLISYIALVSRNLLLRNAREESKDAI